MLLLILGLIIFLGVHSITIFAPKFRAKYREKYFLTWKLLYALTSVVGIVFVIIGYIAAKQMPTVLFIAPHWLKYVVYIALIPVFIFFLAPYFPGKIASLTAHPQLMSVKLWAMAHLFVNGTVPDVILFGSFLIWGIFDVIALKKLPAGSQSGTKIKIHMGAFNDIFLVIAGLGLYIAFLFGLHATLFGAPLL